MKQENIPLNQIKEEAEKLLKDDCPEESELGEFFTQKEFERREGTFEV